MPRDDLDLAPRDAAEPPGCISVVMPAYNSRATILRAIDSALVQPEVLEVIVVDDASSDETFDLVDSTYPPGHRVRLLRMARNGGPARARNAAFDIVRGDLIALLDADDVLAPGRFGRMFDSANDGGWDFLADELTIAGEILPPGTPEGPVEVDLDTFLRGNIARGTRVRELGFLKPVMRKSAIDANALRYREDIRFAEDFLLYFAALQSGCRFLLVAPCGYIVHDMPGSLSKRQTLHDFEKLREAVSEIARARVSPALAEYFTFLDVRIQYLRLLATRYPTRITDFAAIGFSNPRLFARIAKLIVIDKVRRFQRAACPAAQDFTR